MKKLMLGFIALYSAFALTACPDGNSDGGSMIPVCPTTHVFDSSQNACIPINGSGVVVPNAGPVQYYDFNRSFQPSGWGVQTYNGDMQITNTAAYKTFLKEAMAVCDRMSNTWGYQAGLAKCDNWVSGSFQITMQIPPNLRPQISFKAYPAPNFYQYAVSFGIDGGGMAYNPLTLSQDTTFSLVNNSKGFEIRSYGSWTNGGGLRLIQIIVREGTLNDGYVNYELFYPHNGQATKIAAGKMKRY